MKTTEKWQKKQSGMNVEKFFFFAAFVKLFPKRKDINADNSIKASFSTESGEGYKVDSKIIFQNKSRFASAYVWDFGDGQVSTEEHPRHIYETPGAYVVKLLAISDSGSDSEKQLIEID